MREKESPRSLGLARTLSKRGYCSRSKAVDLVRAGRVSLNGAVRRDPETRVSGPHGRIAVDGALAETPTKIYRMMNKPRGVVTTVSDERGRATVYTVLDTKSAGETNLGGETKPWLAPVGRIDKASEGLLLFTNDSEWSARVTSPETHLEKTYHVQVSAVADDKFLQALTIGVKATDGELLRARRCVLLRAGEKNCWLEIILDEGKNRQIRRMVEAMGVEVLRLLRVAIGPLKLGNLAKGSHRDLTSAEKQMLDRAMRRNA